MNGQAGLALYLWHMDIIIAASTLLTFCNEFALLEK
jgi:hypothetical protein